jgi:arsenite transporter
MIALLHAVARQGRWALVGGLIAGLALPDLAALLRPLVPALVAVLLFLTALRIGPGAAFGGLRAARGALGWVLIWQLAAPLVALAVLALLGAEGTALGLVVVLMLAAPSVTGAPSFAILMGQNPAPALRMLLMGTAVLPLTALPVLWALPGLGPFADVLGAALRLLAVIFVACAGGFALHRALPRPPDTAALDGMTALLLSVIVVGLMAALGPALGAQPARVAGWLGVALVLNLGLQVLADAGLRRARHPAPAGPAIIAGNRNIALFLVALPETVTEPLMIFIGCYQIPMYLTPILMRPLHARPLG